MESEVCSEACVGKEGLTVVVERHWLTGAAAVHTAELGILV